MGPGDLLPLWTALGGASGGTAIIMLILFITGQVVSRPSHEEMRQDRDEWRRIAELERARADAGVVAGQVVKDVMLHLRKELD